MTVTRDPATGRFQSPDPAPPPGLPPIVFPGSAARAAIPGAHGCPPRPRPFRLAGVVWQPQDADVWAGSPIGLALAVETVQQHLADLPDPDLDTKEN